MYQWYRIFQNIKIPDPQIKLISKIPRINTNTGSVVSLANATRPIKSTSDEDNKVVSSRLLMLLSLDRFK
jgi:hypothetical protein